MAVNWAYVAGFFDGEGCISFATGKRTSHTVTVAIAQSAKNRGLWTLEQIQQFLWKHGVKSRITVGRPYSATNANFCYQLRSNGARYIIPFLRGMFPYLMVKKTAAQDYLRFATIFPPMYGRLSARRCFTQQDVEEMRKQRNDKVPWANICKSFGISKMTLWRFTSHNACPELKYPPTTPSLQ